MCSLCEASRDLNPPRESATKPKNNFGGSKCHILAIIVNNSRNLLELAQPQRQRKKSIKVLAWKHNLKIFFAELFFQVWKVSGSVSAVGLGSKLSFIKPCVELRGLMERRIYFFFKKTVKITQILNLRSSISETPWVSSLALGGHMVLIEERRLWHRPPKWNLGAERWKI